MFKILIISVITILLVIITLLIFMSFLNVDIKINSNPVKIEKFNNNNFISVIITNSGSNLTNHQINFTLYYNDSLNINFQDIRIFDNDKITPLDYYIEDVINGISASIWVKIPSLSMSKYIYISYGNSFSIGNPNNVFDLYDDFNYLDTNKWETLGGTPTITNGIISIPNGSYHGKTHLLSKNILPLNIVAEVKMSASGSGIIPELSFRTGNINNNNGIMCRYDTRGTGNSGMGVILNNPFNNWPILSHPSPGILFPADNIIKKTKTIINENNIKSFYSSNETSNYILIHSYDFSTEKKYNTQGKFGFNNHVGGMFNISEVKIYKATNNNVIVHTNQDEQKKEFDRIKNNNNIYYDDEYKLNTINDEFIENNKKYIYNTKYDSSINIENQNISLVEKNPNRIIRSSTFPTIFPPNRYINGYFKENGAGENLIIVFKDPFVLKKITFVADNDIKTAPASCDIYYIENREPILIKNIIATYEDYSEFEGKSQNTCIKFFIDNNLNVNKYLIVFKSVLGGTELKFNKIILYEGIIPKVNILASASSSIQKN